MKKIFLIIIFVCITIFISGYKSIDKYVINPEKNAFYHNNLGVNYIRERVYFAAIQEFKIAISLSPSTQATAVFKNNLGETYMFVGYYDAARYCFEDALEGYGLNFKYYLNLIDCYVHLGIAKTKQNEYLHSKNEFDKIKLGILYIKTGQTRRGINLLDEFCISEPDLMITPAIRQYLKEVTMKVNK